MAKFFKSAKNKPICFDFDFSEFVVRITEKRVDIENRAKTWKTVLFSPTWEYNFWLWLLVPELYRHDPACVERANSEASRKQDQESAKEIARALYIASSVFMHDPSAIKEAYAVFSASLDRQNAAQDEAKKELTLEEQAILAEEVAQADPTEENIDAARQARELADNPPKKTRRSKKK